MKSIQTNNHLIEDSLLETFTIDSGIKGNQLLVIGAIHGNESCGPESINSIIKEIKEGLISIVTGSVTFIPISNPLAYSQSNRQVNIDLGRNFNSQKIDHEYEKNIILLLETYIQKCDYLLDIHSTLAKTDPCIFEDYPDKHTHEFANAIGIKNILTGWPKLYTQSDSPDANMYAHEKGKTGILIECGSHLDESAKEIGVTAIKNSLNYLQISPYENTLNTMSTLTIDMKKLFLKQKDGYFPTPWKNLEPISAGTVIAIHHDGTIIKAKQDGYIILPKHNAEIGDEWFYFGK